MGSSGPSGVDHKQSARFFLKYVAICRRHTALLVGAFLALAIGAAFVASHLELHTAWAELLPDSHPAVVALNKISSKQKSSTSLVLIIESQDREANRRFAEAMRPELEKMRPRLITDVSWHSDDEVALFGKKWRWLYADVADLQQASDLFDRVLAKRTSPFSVDLEGDPDKELEVLRQRLQTKVPQQNPSPYYEMSENRQQFLGLVLQRRGEGFASSADHELVAALDALVQRLGPTSFHPSLRVQYSGGIAQAIDEQNGIRDDLALASILCFLAVMAVIYAYFRRALLLWVIGAPAVLGLLLSLTIAEIFIRYLNMNTAFLISIILGNGINAPIILLARYGEERQLGHEVDASLAVALSSTLRGTATAMIAASVAYGCLLLTSFRGFNQFGLLGGAGMLLVWLATFALVPPLVMLGERWFPGRLTPRRNLWRRPFFALGRLSVRTPILLSTVTLLLIAAATVPLVRYARDPLEWNFENLRTDDTPSQRLWPVMESLLGLNRRQDGSNVAKKAVFIVDSAKEAEKVAAEIRKQDAARGSAHIFKSVVTLQSLLPPDQNQKLELLAALKKKIDRHVDSLSADDKRVITEWRPPDYLRTLTVKDLPAVARENFTEVSGELGRLVALDTDPATYSDWDGHKLLKISGALKVDVDGKSWTAASVSTVFAGMLEAIINDGPRVSEAALFGVALLVLIAFGLRGAVPVLASLAVGVFWLGGILGLIHLKINFMNFVALPITLGVGVDYAANIWARLRSDGVDKLPEVIADTGSAVALCSMTTIIGYSSLLLSHNRALRSFGLLADLGEVCCLVAALVALPSLVQWWAGRRTGGEISTPAA